MHESYRILTGIHYTDIVEFPDLISDGFIRALATMPLRPQKWKELWFSTETVIVWLETMQEKNKRENGNGVLMKGLFAGQRIKKCM